MRRFRPTVPWLIATLVSIVPALTWADGSTIQAVAVQGDASGAELRVSGISAIPTYSVRARDGGKVVVIDIEGASLPKEGIRTAGQTALIVRTIASTTALGVRIEVALTHPAAYHARADSGTIVVRFEELEAEQAVLHSRRAKSAKAEPRQQATRPARVSAPPPAQEDTSLWVQKIQLERRDHRDRVVVELSKPGRFRIVTESGKPAKLVISGARVAPSVSETMEGAEDSLVHRVRVQNTGEDATIEVDQTQGSSGTAIREGNRIVWMFAPGTPSSGRPRTVMLSREKPLPGEILAETETAEAAPFLPDVPLQVRANRERRGQYSGRHVDLDFKDADIHNILRLVAEVGGVNVVTSDDVSGTVTIRMRDVPWDQALDVILQSKGLGMVRRGNLIRVAPLATLEKEREAAIARLKQQEQLAPLETRLVPVSYATATGLQPRVQELLSARGSVSVDERTNVIIVRDIVENLDDIEELVRTLDTQTPQVLIEARIVEASSQYARDIGIQWGGDGLMSTATGNPTGLVFPANFGIAGGNYEQSGLGTQGLSPFSATVSPANYAVNLPAVTGTGQGGAIGMTFGSVSGAVNLNVRLSAAESTGVVHIVSAPRILTLDNHEAHIAQGTLIPYSQVSAQGVQTAFQEAKLQLIVKPHVTSDGSVSMHMKVTRDEPDFTRTGPRGDPTILKREAETDLLIADGNTAVIGGIYTRTKGRNLDQVPFFGDIPILGVLFQRRRTRDDRSELLIFLTPRIVNRNLALRQ